MIQEEEDFKTYSLIFERLEKHRKTVESLKNTVEEVVEKNIQRQKMEEIEKIEFQRQEDKRKLFELQRKNSKYGEAF